MILRWLDNPDAAAGHHPGAARRRGRATDRRRPASTATAWSRRRWPRPARTTSASRRGRRASTASSPRSSRRPASTTSAWRSPPASRQLPRQPAGHQRLAPRPPRGGRRRRRPAARHRRPAPHRHDDPLRPPGPGPRPAGPADLGGRPPRARRRRPTTYDTDPRIDEVQATLDMADVLMPGLHRLPPDGRPPRPGVRADHRRRLPQHDLPHAVPGADLQPLAARRGRPRLRLPLAPAVPPAPPVRATPPSSGCSSRPPTSGTSTRWPPSTPTPSSCRPTGIRSKVIASVSALVAHLRGMASDETSVAEAAAEYGDDIFVGLDRGMAARDRARSPATRSSTCSSPTSWPIR